MQAEAQHTLRLVMIDDDLMSREVLCLMAAEAGMEAVAFESGEAALETLTGDPIADAILADMQMPGLCGDALALRLRAICGHRTTILAMSGTAVPLAKRTHYNGFLLKPFSIEDLQALLDRSGADLAPQTATAPADGVLDQATYGSFARSLTPAQLKQLYAMSLDDAERRIGQMRDALVAGDDDGWRQAAHSIKGGCGMVGAVELARLAGRMESDGLACVDSKSPSGGILEEFLAASARLRRILDAQQS
jgi:CheY-like chemotaxis protein/HPt (histidine-containing phosphotransfer) domain-containing protein